MTELPTRERPGSAGRAGSPLRIAVPVSAGRPAEHFGHCEEFAIFHTDDRGKEIDGVVMVPAPPHQPGLLPEWLRGLGVDVILAGGMGSRARDLFDQHCIEVVIGVRGESAREVADAYLSGTLEAGGNPCDH
jgi:ATP-binding protein involved in chromosome partitioning